MKKIHLLHLWPFIFCLMIVLSLSDQVTDSCRSMLVAGVSPFWKKMKENNYSEDYLVETNQLKLQNQILSNQISAVYEWISFEERIDQQMKRIKEFNDDCDELNWNEFYR